MHNLAFSVGSSFLEKLACPSCFTINGCKPDECNQECVKECKNKAIRIKNKTAIIDKNLCRICGSCAQVCPLNAIDKPSLRTVDYNKDFYLFCDNCKTLYPFKDVVYITQQCEAKKCNLECISACNKKALYFPKLVLNYYSKHLKINKNCNYCGKCAQVCPENALISVKTPFLYPEHINPFSFTYNGNNMHHNSKNEMFPEQKVVLRILKTEGMPSAAYLTNIYLGSELKKQVPNLIIDNGCGSNNFKVMMRELGIDVVGIDISIDRSAFMPVQLLSNGEFLPFQNNSLDMLTSNFVLEHASDPKRYLTEIYRVLKNGGVAFISVPTPYFHLAYALKFDSYLKYGLHVLNDYKRFLKNPIKDFMIERAHEKDWNVEGSKKNVTFVDEIKKWRTENWEKMYGEVGFEIVSKKITGNILSLYAGNLSKKLGNPNKIGVHCTYILEK